MRLTAGNLVLLAAACLACGCRRDDDRAAGRAEPRAFEMVLDAEAGAGKTIWQAGADAAGGVVLPNLRQEELATVPPLQYAFRLDRPETVHVWLRCWWQDGCSNSVQVQIDDGLPMIAGNDSIYNRWHWVKGPSAALAAGNHRLVLRAREPNVRLDQILLTAAAAVPAAGPGGRRTAAPTAATAPDLSVTDLPPPPPVVGIAGDYMIGWEPTVVQLGLPYRRVTDVELMDFARLKQFRVLCVTQLRNSWDVSAVETFLAQGGAVIMEDIKPRRRNQSRICRALQLAELPLNAEEYRTRWGSDAWRHHPFILDGQGSRFFRSLGEAEEYSSKFPFKQWAYKLPLECEDMADYETHGLVAGNKRVSPAIAVGRLGKGKLYYFTTNFGFSGIRSDRYQPICENVLLEAVGDACRPVYQGLDWGAARGGPVYFRDDFMRPRQDGVGWAVESGKWELTADIRKPKFCLVGTSAANDSAVIETGKGSWPLARISAAVDTAGKGQGGVWLGLPDGRRAVCRFAADADRIILAVLDRDGGEQATAAAAAPLPCSGWRRLSLQAETDRWVGSVDGVPVVRLPAAMPPPTTRLTAGLIAADGACAFDDVDLRPADTLLPGSDRAYGEEGSPRAFPRLRQGLEFRSVYSPLFELRPVAGAGKDLLVQYTLPTFSPSSLYVDGRLVGTLKAAADGPVGRIPAALAPKTSLGVVNPDIHDYLFDGQVIDWYSNDSNWFRQPRWDCDSRYSWLGANSWGEPTCLWYRRPLTPPYAVRFLVAEAMGTYREGKEKGRELNIIVGGNGMDLKQGIVFRTNRRTVEIRRDGKVVKTVRNTPFYQGWKLHHLWIDLRVVVTAEAATFLCDGRVLARLALDQPLPAGHAAVWTQRNYIQLARATVVTGGQEP